MKRLPALALLLCVSLAFLRASEVPAAVSPEAIRAINAKVLATATAHLDALLAHLASRRLELKGKSAAGMTALAFQHAFEATGNAAYRAAALKLADDILADMRATKFGVLYIKEKTKEDGDDIAGGGPPALGWYVSALAAVYAHEPNRVDALRYVGGVLDRFPWNEQGWWAATIDIRTGEPKVPLTKPSPINKNAAMASASAIAAKALRPHDPALADRLAAKARVCVERQIIPAQESDGFWHYGLTGNDPKDKDVFGYFMLTIDEMVHGRVLGEWPTSTGVARALERAGDFAATEIAPMSDPHPGQSTNPRMTRGTPKHYAIAEEPKRHFQLAVALIGTGRIAAGLPILEHALKHFPTGERGQDGAQAAHAVALIHHLLRDATEARKQE